MSILSRLFGGGDKSSSAEPVSYKDFRITPEPIREGTVYRIAATIEADVDGETKSHRLIRADTLNDHDAATEASISKARQVIDEQGMRLFG